jgi:hypothetical protein
MLWAGLQASAQPANELPSPKDLSAKLIFKQRQKPDYGIIYWVWLINSCRFVLDIGVEDRKSLLLNPIVVTHLFVLDMTATLRGRKLI